MDEINYIPTDTYYGNSINENVTITNNELVINSERSLSNNQSECEVDIKSLLISKYEKKNENLKQKPKLDINTMESIRISHSLEKSKNSQSLTQIINQPFILIQKNSKDENCSNQTYKFKNNNSAIKKEGSSFESRCFYYNDNNEEKNSLISIKDNKNIGLNEHIISELNQDFFNDKKRYKNINDKDNINDFNNNCLKKCKIGNIFKEIFEEKIKSNKLSENESFKKNDSVKNKNEIKEKLLGYKNKESFYLSLFDSDKYSCSNTKKSSSNQVKEKELTIEINNNNKEKCAKDTSIDLNNKEKKILIISNIDNITEYSIENQDEEKIDNFKNKNINIKKENKNHIILNAFENENENEDDYDKNVMISELDIKISKSLSEEENKTKNSPNKNKELSTNINKSNYNESEKEKYDVINTKNLNTEVRKSKRKRNNIIKYIYKKTFKYGGIPGKKICSFKSTKNTKNIKSVKNIKGKKAFNFEYDILKKYKSNSPFSNNDTKTTIKKHNILINSRSNCSFFTLNSSILNRINMNNKTLNIESIRKSYSRYLNTSSSLPKNKKIKVHYIKYLTKKINILPKNTHVNRNKYFQNKGNENNNNQNNDTKEKTFTNTIENKNKRKIIDYNKLSKINTSFFTKMNRVKDFTIFAKNNKSHFTRIMNNSHKRNSCKNEKNSSKKEFHLFNINKDMMLFKRIINRTKKTDLYSFNTKLLKKNNLNNFKLKEKIYRNQNEKNIQSEPFLFKNDNKIKNTNNSFNKRINSYNCKKSINNTNKNCSNSLLLTNINSNKNLMNQNRNTKSKENIIASFKPINKYNTYIINHFINFKESKNKTNKKNKIINDNKFTCKTNITYIKNGLKKNKLLNIKTLKKNSSELKYKINNILITINNNTYNNILQKNKSPFSCRNKAKKNLNFKFE